MKYYCIINFVENRINKIEDAVFKSKFVEFKQTEKQAKRKNCRNIWLKALRLYSWGYVEYT